MECLFPSRFPCVEWSSAGGVLSPILLTIYTDDLLKRLKSLALAANGMDILLGQFMLMM